MPLKEAIESYLKYLRIERNASEHTLLAYRNDLDQFKAFLTSTDASKDEDIDLSKIDRLKIRLWLGSLSEEEYGKTSIARKAAAIRSFFRYAIRRGLCDHDPASLLIIPRKEKRIPIVVDDQEIGHMLDQHPSDTPQQRQDKAILELLYSTGIRVSECTGLNVDDLQLSMKQIQVLGKGRKQRIVPLGDTALRALKDHLETRLDIPKTTDEPNGHLVKRSNEENQDDQSPAKRSSRMNSNGNALFLTPKGQRLYPRAVQRLVEISLSRVSDATRKSPHVIRHSFATQMLDAGADIRMIKEFLGHSSLAATQVYTHTSVEHLKNIHQKAHPRAKK